MELIQRTKAAVRELDNLNYRKMKKILMVDNQENETSSTASNTETEEETSSISSFQDDERLGVSSSGGVSSGGVGVSGGNQGGEDSSKSNSITSIQSQQSEGVSASSQNSSTNSLPPSSLDNDSTYNYPASFRCQTRTSPSVSFSSPLGLRISYGVGFSLYRIRHRLA